MHYSAAVPFQGDVEKAFALAVSALTALGFRIEGQSAQSVELRGPGMHSSRQSPLVGASHLAIRSAQGELLLEADLGGVRRMANFVNYFPLILVLGLGAVLYVVFNFRFGQGVWSVAVGAAVGGNAAIWLLLGPLMARGIRRRTERALDALLANLVAVGETG